MNKNVIRILLIISLIVLEIIVVAFFLFGLYEEIAGTASATALLETFNFPLNVNLTYIIGFSFTVVFIVVQIIYHKHFRN